MLVGCLWLMVPAGSAAARQLQFTLVGVVFLGFCVRRSLPRTATALVTGSTAVGWWFSVTGDPFLIAGFCMFVVAERFGSRRFPWWLVTAYAVLLVSILALAADGVEDRSRGVVTGAVVLGTAWVLGVRTRQVRQETARRVSLEERLILSRDVHDVLSHTLGTIGVRAGVAAHITSTSPDQLRTALREVEEESRAALSELRQVLEWRRDQDEGQPPTAAPLSELIESLARKMRDVGLSVETDVDDGADHQPVAVRTTAYRVIQESLTNIVRHAHATSCSVTVRTVPSQLVIRVDDDGQGASTPPREGQGLRGMRERVTLLGGSVQAHNTGDGFRVHVELPNAPQRETTA